MTIRVFKGKVRLCRGLCSCGSSQTLPPRRRASLPLSGGSASFAPFAAGMIAGGRGSCSLSDELKWLWPAPSFVAVAAGIAGLPECL